MQQQGEGEIEREDDRRQPSPIVAKVDQFNPAKASADVAGGIAGAAATSARVRFLGWAAGGCTVVFCFFGLGLTKCYPLASKYSMRGIVDPRDVITGHSIALKIIPLGYLNLFYSHLNLSSPSLTPPRTSNTANRGQQAAMVQSINLKALSTLASVVRRPYLAAPHVFVPTVSGKNNRCIASSALPPSHAPSTESMLNNQIDQCRGELRGPPRSLRHQGRDIRQGQYADGAVRK